MKGAMHTIINKTPKPIRVPLPGGKTLHLGPGKAGQVSDPATRHPPLKKLVEDGQLEVLGHREGGDGHPGPEPQVNESTHGHHPTTVVKPKGNR